MADARAGRTRAGLVARRGWLPAAALILAAAALAGCSGSGGGASTPRAATQPPAAGATATADTRPAPPGVPAGAQQLRASAQFGDPAGSGSTEDERFYSLNCAADVLTIATTRRIVYADLPCDRSLPSKDAQAFLSRAVRVRVVIASPSKLYIESKTGGTAEFTVGRVWMAPLP